MQRFQGTKKAREKGTGRKFHILNQRERERVERRGRSKGHGISAWISATDKEDWLVQKRVTVILRHSLTSVSECSVGETRRCEREEERKKVDFC